MPHPAANAAQIGNLWRTDFSADHRDINSIHTRPPVSTPSLLLARSGERRAGPTELRFRVSVPTVLASDNSGMME